MKGPCPQTEAPDLTGTPPGSAVSGVSSPPELPATLVIDGLLMWRRPHVGSPQKQQHLKMQIRSNFSNPKPKGPDVQHRAGGPASELVKLDYNESDCD